MAITKQKTATLKEQKCGTCSRTIKVGEKYFDTDEKIGKKPWETKKHCVECGAKISK